MFMTKMEEMILESSQIKDVDNLRVTRISLVMKEKKSQKKITEVNFILGKRIVRTQILTLEFFV